MTRTRNAVSNGRVAFTKHARERMLERGYSGADVYSVLKAGYVGATEPKGTRWRYTIAVAGGRKKIVIEFRPQGEEVVVITVLEVQS